MAPPTAFVFENNTLSNNSHDAGQIFSNDLRQRSTATAARATAPNALFLAGQTASNAPVHINGNTIPLGLEGSPGGGAPTLGVTAAATLAIGPGQHFVGGDGGTIGALSGTLTIDGSTFDSLTGISGELGRHHRLQQHHHDHHQHHDQPRRRRRRRPHHLPGPDRLPRVRADDERRHRLRRRLRRPWARDTTSFSITGNVFSSNFGDGVDIDQSVGGTGGPSYSFVFENNNLGNNSHDAGQIFSNAFGNIDGNTRRRATAPTRSSSTARPPTAPASTSTATPSRSASKASPGAGAPTLGVTTAATLAIGPGQQFVGGAQRQPRQPQRHPDHRRLHLRQPHRHQRRPGTASPAFNNTTTTITNTTISHGGNAAGGPTIFPAQIVCQGCAR